MHLFIYTYLYPYWFPLKNVPIPKGTKFVQIAGAWQRRYSELLVRRPFRSSWIWSFGKRCATWNVAHHRERAMNGAMPPKILYKHILVNGILNSVNLFCWLEVSCKFWSFLWKLAMQILGQQPVWLTKRWQSSWELVWYRSELILRDVLW